MNRTRILLYSLGLLLPLQAGLYWEEAMEHIIKLSYFPIIGLWLLGSKRSKFKLTDIGKFALFLIIWSSVSALFAQKPALSFFEVSIYIIVLLMYLYIANYCANINSLMTIIFSLFISLAFEDLIGLYQNHYGHSIGLDFLGEGSGKLWAWRAIGTLRVPNAFGSYLVLMLPVVISLLFVPLNNKLKIALGTLTASTLAVLIYTYSRSSWIGFVVAMMVFLYLFFKKGLITVKFMKRIFPLLIILFIAVCYYSTKIVDRWQDKEKENMMGIDDHRFRTAEMAIEHIKQNPIMGIGLRNFAVRSFGANVHNTYLRIAAESGIPGLILFLLIIFYIFKTGMKVVRSKYILLSRLAVGILSAYSAFLLMELTGPEYRWFPIIGTFWLYAGLLSAMRRLDLNLKRQEAMKETDQKSAINQENYALIR